MHCLTHVTARDEDVLAITGSVVRDDEPVPVPVADNRARNQVFAHGQRVLAALDAVDDPLFVEFVQEPLQVAAVVAGEFEMAHDVAKRERAGLQRTHIFERLVTLLVGQHVSSLTYVGFLETSRRAFYPTSFSSPSRRRSTAALCVPAQ